MRLFKVIIFIISAKLVTGCAVNVGTMGATDVSEERPFSDVTVMFVTRQDVEKLSINESDSSDAPSYWNDVLSLGPKQGDVNFWSNYEFQGAAQEVTSRVKIDLIDYSKTHFNVVSMEENSSPDFVVVIDELSISDSLLNAGDDSVSASDAIGIFSFVLTLGAVPTYVDTDATQYFEVFKLTPTGSGTGAYLAYEASVSSTTHSIVNLWAVDDSDHKIEVYESLADELSILIYNDLVDNYIFEL